MVRLYESRRYCRLLAGAMVLCGSTAVSCGPCEGPTAAQSTRRRCHRVARPSRRHRENEIGSTDQLDARTSDGATSKIFNTSVMRCSTLVDVPKFGTASGHGLETPPVGAAAAVQLGGGPTRVQLGGGPTRVQLGGGPTRVQLGGRLPQQRRSRPPHRPRPASGTPRAAARRGRPSAGVHPLELCAPRASIYRSR